MNQAELVPALEAVLFAAGSPVSRDRLNEIFSDSDEELISEALDALKNRLDNPICGISLVYLDGSYQLCTKPEAADYVKKALEMRKVPPLSKASLEVLAIIAYNQPVTRSFIEQVRGIESSSIVASLLDKGLICERGQLDAPGRPTLFGTTASFLRCFGLSCIQELPGGSGETETSQTLPEIIGSADLLGGMD